MTVSPSFGLANTGSDYSWIVRAFVIDIRYYLLYHISWITLLVILFQVLLVKKFLFHRHHWIHL